MADKHELKIVSLQCCAFRELHNIQACISEGGPEQVIRQLCETIDAKVHKDYTESVVRCLCPACNPRIEVRERDYLTRFIYRVGCAYYIFTSVDNYGQGYGKVLAEYIIANKLGEANETLSCLNPNTNNTVRMFMWKVNRNALAAYRLKELRK